jgi:class 3 adenylate cyclase
MRGLKTRHRTGGVIVAGHALFRASAGSLRRPGPGEVLIGESIARDEPPPGVAFEEIGPVPLKGVGRPVAIFRTVRVG